MSLNPHDCMFIHKITLTPIGCTLGIQYMKTLRISLNNLPLENTAVIIMGQFDKKKSFAG